MARLLFFIEHRLVQLQWTREHPGRRWRTLALDAA